jgi:hypothetical protein
VGREPSVIVVTAHIATQYEQSPNHLKASLFNGCLLAQKTHAFRVKSPNLHLRRNVVYRNRVFLKPR